MHQPYVYVQALVTALLSVVWHGMEAEQQNKQADRHTHGKHFTLTATIAASHSLYIVLPASEHVHGGGGAATVAAAGAVQLQPKQCATTK